MKEKEDNVEAIHRKDHKTERIYNDDNRVDEIEANRPTSLYPSNKSKEVCKSKETYNQTPNKGKEKVYNEPTTLYYAFHASGIEKTQEVVGFRCVWCDTLVFRDIDCLMLHLQSFHHHFEYIMKQKNQTTITLHRNYKNSDNEFFMFKVDEAHVPKLFAHQERIILPSPPSPPLSSTEFTSGDFVNSCTFAPFTADNDIIAENNACKHWTEQQNDEEIDATGDIADGAKLLMKSWCRFVNQESNSLCESNFPDFCRRFATAHAAQILKLDLRQIFARQLLAFCENGSLDKYCLVDFLRIIDDHNVEV
ncbi:9434_t:CDS:2 [Entrophospora sp. SA101]|nr:9434_t:CDS:2 [Entrophospora sp. SA101]